MQMASLVGNKRSGTSPRRAFSLSSIFSKTTGGKCLQGDTGLAPLEQACLHARGVPGFMTSLPLNIYLVARDQRLNVGYSQFPNGTLSHFWWGSFKNIAPF